MKTNIPNPLRLYLIRHGETEWSLNRWHTGLTDIPLTENGESEAGELGKHLQDIQFSHVLTSPSRRAQQTCSSVGLDQVPEIEPDLVEWDYGDYEGKQSVNIRKERPNWNVFRDGCPIFTVEYSVRADQMAVCEFLDINRQIPPVSFHDKSLRVQFESLIKLFK